MTSSTTVRTGTLDVPGARLYYEVRGSGPLLAFIGAPMGLDGFTGVADLLADEHTVLTTDPRGVGASPVPQPESDSTPEIRADDLSRLLTELDAGPATVFGSSGGAITGLALVQAHPEQVHTLIAHEPPVGELLADVEGFRADTERVLTAYRSGDRLGAWRLFLAQASIAVPEEAVAHMFGDPQPQALADERHWFHHEMRATTRFRPDLDRLRAVPTRIVVGVGAESAGQLCDRTSTALAVGLGLPVTSFPGGHTGFTDDPTTFAPRLRAVLAGD